MAPECRVQTGAEFSSTIRGSRPPEKPLLSNLFLFLSFCAKYYLNHNNVNS
jgi:hypothetical protein